MAQENTREQKLKYAFSSLKSVQELHVTSDDSMFVNPSDAKNHASTLEDKEVKIELRSKSLSKATTSVVNNQLDLEREELAMKHLELFGKRPVKTIGIDKLKEKVTEEQKRLQEVSERDSQALKDDSQDDSGEEE